MARFEIFQFPILADNYAVLLHDPGTGQTAAIDAADSDAIAGALRDRGWTLSDIFVTHHHGDHTAGVAALKQVTGATVHGPAADTSGHIVYHLPEDRLAFVGDVLFSLGCGRVIEGTMTQMWNSLDTLRRLPPETIVYCGHEYTLANARFALTVESGNAALQKRAEEVAALRARSMPTLPTTIGAERAANPFLRPDSAEIRKVIAMPSASDAEVFAELRQRKNRS